MYFLTATFSKTMCVFLGNNLLSRSSKQQHTLSRSSAEAEYRGVSNVVAETAWLRNLLRELHTPLLYVTLVYCDNVSVIYFTVNPVRHQRVKNIEIDIHFVNDMVAQGHWDRKSLHDVGSVRKGLVDINMYEITFLEFRCIGCVWADSGPRNTDWMISIGLLQEYKYF
ncbi:ribonuclease H-like domain-containing protein [Tanacetum coccineum]